MDNLLLYILNKHPLVAKIGLNLINLMNGDETAEAIKELK